MLGRCDNRVRVTTLLRLRSLVPWRSTVFHKHADGVPPRTQLSHAAAAWTGADPMRYRSVLPEVQIPEMRLADFVFEHADRVTDKPALIDGPTDRSLTYGQLVGAIQKAAGGLARRGFGKGDVFATYSPNLPEYAIVFFAVTTVGGIVTTVNPLYTADELSHQLEDAGLSCW